MQHAGDYVCEAVGYAPHTPGSQKIVQLNVEKCKFDCLLTKTDLTQKKINKFSCFSLMLSDDDW